MEILLAGDGADDVALLEAERRDPARRVEPRDCEAATVGGGDREPAHQPVEVAELAIEDEAQHDARDVDDGRLRRRRDHDGGQLLHDRRRDDGDGRDRQRRGSDDRHDWRRDGRRRDGRRERI